MATDSPSEQFDDAEFEIALHGYGAARDGTARGLRESGILNMIQTEEHAAGFAQQALTILDANIASLPSHGEKACRSGCAFCCHQRIDVTPMQALAVAAFLRATLPSAELGRLRERLQSNAAQVSEWSQAEYARARLPCALLDADQSCSVYSVRPTACAGWHSTSRERCEEIYEEGDPGAEGVPADMAALLQARGFEAGLIDAIGDRQLDARSYELHSAVLCALDHPDAAAAWLDRRPAFEECTPGVVLSDTVLRTERADGSVLSLKFRGLDAEGATFVVEDSRDDAQADHESEPS